MELLETEYRLKCLSSKEIKPCLCALNASMKMNCLPTIVFTTITQIRNIVNITHLVTSQPFGRLG